MHAVELSGVQVLPAPELLSWQSKSYSHDQVSKTVKIGISEDPKILIADVKIWV